MGPERVPGPWWQRLGWMVAIWVGSVLALGVVAGVIRMWLLR